MPFSEEKADKAVQFIEARCRHTKGDFAGLRFKLNPWQRDGIIRPLFGTVNEHGLRQFRTAFVSRAKKNGKSAEGAAIALYLLCGDGEAGAEVYSAAADRDQAAIIFNVAAQMVRLDPVLSKACRVIDSTKRILYKDRVYRTLSAEAFSKHGFNFFLLPSIPAVSLMKSHRRVTSELNGASGGQLYLSRSGQFLVSAEAPQGSVSVNSANKYAILDMKDPPEDACESYHIQGGRRKVVHTLCQGKVELFPFAVVLSECFVCERRWSGDGNWWRPARSRPVRTHEV